MPSLDEGSNPSGSTSKRRIVEKQFSFLFIALSDSNPRRGFEM
ncbi:hypothetical protein C900_01255 [Fulvivirga imtechensis AK7]|uniref:Uncharacterized protein n=1 Tax=Fulvivirga imtechensis AK7 TaxID=1237149 RepID=L8JGT2_9BACT|nr:hypothetical protein C900_01255 [Fulvivirga imtechensis AK7]